MLDAARPAGRGLRLVQGGRSAARPGETESEPGRHDRGIAAGRRCNECPQAFPGSVAFSSRISSGVRRVMVMLNSA